MAQEQAVGKVIHYYTHLQVATILLKQGELKVGDTIHVKGHTTDFTQQISSMQIEHKEVSSAKMGDHIGIRVIDHVREHDMVFKVTE